MFAADDLDRPGNLFQVRVIHVRLQHPQRVEERLGLLRCDTALTFSEQKDVEGLQRPERRNERLLTCLEAVKHIERQRRLFVGKAPGQSD